jgi:hypothetical protein
MRAFGEETFQAIARERDGIGPRDAEGIEAVFAGGLAQRVLDRGYVQKSRSA